jgi:squalene-associated FAD-dependent desaturase
VAVPATGKRVVVIGGGLAGISAGCALADAGFRVTLLERRPFLGGRASSYEHPATGEVVDNCQHVLLGCCTNLLDLYRRFGAEEKIGWFDRLNFIEPGGKRSEIRPSWLPAPFHTAPSFLAASSLSVADKISVSRAMLALMGHLPDDSKENFLSWLQRHGQTQRAIDRFWSVVLVSALNEDLDRVSVRYGAQVFRESFLKSAAAGRMGIPRVPLTELYSAGADYIRTRGGEVRLRASVESLDLTAAEVTAALNSGESISGDFAVLAIPYNNIEKLKIAPEHIAVNLLGQTSRFESSPITGIHLWFDRSITELEHAVLLDRTIQWMFHKSKLLSRHQENGVQGSYVELVVSASRSLIDKNKNEVVELALSELADFFPAVREAKLLKSAVIKEFHATYSALPLSDAYRPGTRTESPRLFLAGDWTATSWPATMEGAVRSGYMAAEALAAGMGASQRFLVPDLPAQGLMRLFE